MAANPLTSIPIIGGFFDDSQDQALEQLQKNQALYKDIATPDFKNYVPENYAVAGNYDPTLAQAKTIQEDPNLRSSQLSALNKMSGLADTGLSEVDNAGYERARQLAGQISHSGTDAALQNAQARGTGGSGLEFSMREQAAQDAAERAQQAGLAQAADSAKQRAAYTQAYGSALSGLRNQDYNANAGNADILNKFTQYNTTNQNQAQQYNLGNRQNVSNMNVQGRNSAQQYNNDLLQKQYADQMQKANAQAGANTGMAGGYADINAANTSNRNTLTGIGAWAAGGGLDKVFKSQPTQPKTYDNNEAGYSGDV